jgi:hypothetical protein
MGKDGEPWIFHHLEDAPGLSFFGNSCIIIPKFTTPSRSQSIKVMKKYIKSAAQRAANNPVLQKSAQSLKPDQSLWGVLGVLLFFILPEIVSFIWGAEITEWAHAHTITEPTEIGRRMYWILEKLFEDGISWLNLGIGIALLGWLTWDWRRSPRDKFPS